DVGELGGGGAVGHQCSVIALLLVLVLVLLLENRSSTSTSTSRSTSQRPIRAPSVSHASATATCGRASLTRPSRPERILIQRAAASSTVMITRASIITVRPT